ncbi:MAG: reverse transcriptase domain-containing protein [Pseudomonadota bacterium]
MEVTSGVPQGSILGPYLFALTTASYKPTQSECKVIRYADDTTLCFPLYHSSDNGHVQKEHEYLLQWSKSMDLQMNVLKCKYLIVSKRNCKLVNIPVMSDVTEVESMDILGVTYNSKGTWTQHFNRVNKIASRRLYALRILKPCLSHEKLLLVYYATVRSILEYCGPLFVGVSGRDAEASEILQRRFHRLLCGKACTSECIQSLHQRRQIQALKLLQKTMFSQHILSKYLPPLSSRGRFILPMRNTCKRSKTFFLYTSCKMYNQLLFKR